MLTRICYFAVGMIDELPPLVGLEDWLQLCETSLPQTVKAEGEPTSIWRSTGAKKKAKEAKKSQITPSLSSSSEDEKTDEDNDSEKIETDDEEKKIKEELRNHPAISA